MSQGQGLVALVSRISKICTPPHFTSSLIVFRLYFFGGYSETQRIALEVCSLEFEDSSPMFSVCETENPPSSRAGKNETKPRSKLFKTWHFPSGHVSVPFKSRIFVFGGEDLVDNSLLSDMYTFSVRIGKFRKVFFSL